MVPQLRESVCSRLAGYEDAHKPVKLAEGPVLQSMAAGSLKVDAKFASYPGYDRANLVLIFGVVSYERG